MKTPITAGLLAAACWTVANTLGQVETLPASETEGLLRQLPELRRAVSHPALKAHLAAQTPAGTPSAVARAVNAVRVARDAATLASPAPIVHYRVPATSDAQYLPDTYPYNGRALVPVGIVSGTDAYEPGSFLLYPLKDLGRVELVLDAFKTRDGRVFPRENLDLAVVKVWYQNGNGWYSFFMCEGGLKLCPELLLHDEARIEADTAREQNFARVRGEDGRDKRVWMTPYKNLEETFKPVRGNFADADTLQPVTLEAGAFKQFFLTAHIPAGTPAGLYSGAVRVVQAGATLCTVPVRLRVLPFQLPRPKCHFDETRDFICDAGSSLSIRHIGPERFARVMADFRRHGIEATGCGYPYSEDALKTFEIIKALGFRLDGALFTGGWRHIAGDNRYAWRNTARRVKKQYRDLGLEVNGRPLGYADEPGDATVKNFREQYAIYQEEGFTLAIAGHGSIYRKAAYCHSDVMIATRPEDAETPRRWNEIGLANVSWYAYNHNSTENPCFTRRQYGLACWLAGFSAIRNNTHALGPYNDRSRTTYKPFVDSYFDGKGHITTLQFEGKREGIDDIRYATLLRTLAKQAAASPDFRIANRGRMALQFFADIESTLDEPATLRLEMIRHILDLLKLTTGAQGGTAS